MKGATTAFVRISLQNDIKNKQNTNLEQSIQNENQKKTKKYPNW